MKRRLLLGLALALIEAGALALRLPALDNRPMHGDEAVHAFKLRELWETGRYRYDPQEFHGPTLYYATLPSMWLSDARRFADTSEKQYRIVTALFGAATVLLLALLADGLGWRATLCAAALLGCSPALVLYSRYYIQETLLGFFTVAMLACGWRYTRHPSPGWLLAAGACAGLMVATKETALLSFAARAVAMLPSLLRARRQRSAICWWQAKHAGAALAVGTLTACLLLSGFLTNPAGPVAWVRALATWSQRAGETELHRHPWHYYLSTLVYTHRVRGPAWSEGLIVGLALLGLLAAFGKLRARGLEASAGCVRFLGLYALVLTAAYSLIPYKTPWCLVTFLQGMILLAGVGAVALVRRAPGRIASAVAGLLLLAGCGHLAWLSYQTSFVYTTDGRNPYAYAQTVPDAIDLGQRVEDLLRVSRQGDRTIVKLIAEDEYYFPLPWYLRRCVNVGYWTRMPPDPAAPVVIASSRFDQELARRLGATHQMTGYFGLRPTVVFGVWVEKGLWQAYLETRRNAPPRTP